MAVAAASQVVTDFSAGLVTEASGLNFPEKAVAEINNCDIDFSGGIRRRLGLALERNGVKVGDNVYKVTDAGSMVWQGLIYGYRSSGANPIVPHDELATTVHMWPNAGGVEGNDFVCIQIGGRLIFRRLDQDAVSNPAGVDVTAAMGIPFVEQSGYVYLWTAVEAIREPLQSTIGNTRLFFTSNYTIPFYAEWVEDLGIIRLRPVGYTDSLTIGFGGLSYHNSTLPVRDFNGIEDGLDNAERPVTLSKEHLYNLMNQGWTIDAINAYQAYGLNLWVSNGQIQSIGKDSSDVFSPTQLDKSALDNGRAPRGRHIIHALVGKKITAWDSGTFSLSRGNDGVLYAGDFPTTFPGGPGVGGHFPPLSFPDAIELSELGFRSCAFFAGRLFLAGDSNSKRRNGVYFSRVITSQRDAGSFMQRQDPTSEHFPDLLDDDGGVVYIPEADIIVKLIPFGPGVLVIAQNGVWFVYGPEKGFTATSYSVEKIGSIGTSNPLSVVQSEAAVFFMGAAAIYAISGSPQTGLPILTDVSTAQIGRLYNDISLDARASAASVYDDDTKTVFWMWRSGAVPTKPNLKDTVLALDLRSNSFRPYILPVSETNAFGVLTAFPSKRIISTQVYDNVVTNSGDNVVTNGGVQIVEGIVSLAAPGITPNLKWIVGDGPSNCTWLCDLHDTTFTDFVGFTSIAAVPYTSTFTTGPIPFDPNGQTIQHRKQTNYVHSFFTRTEVGFDIEGGNLLPKTPSGCLLSGRWNFHNTATGGRWTVPQQAYRYRRPYVPVGIADTYDTGESILSTKLKIRGEGKALALHYESVPYKDFRFIGYAIDATIAAN